MKSSIVFEVMRDKMTYKEYYKQATAQVSYHELGQVTSLTSTMYSLNATRKVKRLTNASRYGTMA